MIKQTQNSLEKANQLLDLVSPEKLDSLVKKYRADFSANKLHSLVFLKLFLYSWAFDGSGLSLRTVAQNSKSPIFKKLADLSEDFSVGKSGLSERLAKIPYQLFQELFEDLAEKAVSVLPSNDSLSDDVKRLIEQSHILDSTIIDLAVKLAKFGYHTNTTNLGLKASIAIHGKKIPIKALILTEETFSSEDKALPTLFDFNRKGVIYVFDRGIRRGKTYGEIADSGNYFVSRPTISNYEIVKKNILPKKCETETLVILKDELINYLRLPRRLRQPFRLITAKSKRDKKKFTFITNLFDEKATDITDIYRYRWGIEIFFRFLKQELYLEKLLSYSENGAKVQIYLTLIAFILTWVYKEQNAISSFRRAREELRWTLIDKLMEIQFQEGFIAGVMTGKFWNSS